MIILVLNKEGKRAYEDKIVEKEGKMYLNNRETYIDEDQKAYAVYRDKDKFFEKKRIKK